MIPGDAQEERYGLFCVTFRGGKGARSRLSVIMIHP